MARYSFTGPGYGWGGGSYGVGSALMNALGGGINLANGFRDLENRNITDQFRVPAQAAGYDALGLQYSNQALQNMAASAELTNLAMQPPVPQAGLYDVLRGTGNNTQGLNTQFRYRPYTPLGSVFMGQ